MVHKQGELLFKRIRVLRRLVATIVHCHVFEYGGNLKLKLVCNAVALLGLPVGVPLLVLMVPPFPPVTAKVLIAAEH